MLTLAMRPSQHSDVTRVPSSGLSTNNNNGDEFVDILQVQQILLDSNRRDPGGLHPAPSQVPPRLVMDATTSSYYYSTPTYHQTPPGSAGASMDELVAMWFSGGPSASSKLTFPVKNNIHEHLLGLIYVINKLRLLSH